MSEVSLARAPLFRQVFSVINIFRPIHKSNCDRPSNQTELALKLAERAMAVESLMEYLCLHAVLLLELNKDKANAGRFLVQVVCSTQVADLPGYMQRMMSGLPNDDNAEVLLSFSNIKRIPIEETPDLTQRVAAQAKEKAKKTPGAENALVVTFLFTSGESWQTGGITASVGIFEWMLLFMASNPKSIIRSAMFGDQEVPLDQSTLRE